MTTITLMVEIPITVEYTAHKAEGDGWNSPRIPAHIEIENFSVSSDAANKYIKEHHLDWIEEWCEDAARNDRDSREMDRVDEHRNERMVRGERQWT